MKTHTQCLATLLAILCGAMVLTAEAAPLRLKVLARTNDPAPGVASGRFVRVSPQFGNDFQFCPPAAGLGGYVAFQGAAAVYDANGNQVEGGGPGIWAGVEGNLAKIVIRRQATPPLGTNTFPGLMNVNEAGNVPFFANATRGDGLWLGNINGGLELLQQMVFGAAQRPLQSANYVAFTSLATNWIYNTDTRELRMMSYRGFPATNSGLSMTLSNAGTIVALTTDGQLLLVGPTSDGTNRLFFINKLGVIVPVMSQGDPAPGIPNQRIGSMTVSGNDQGYVAVAVGRLDDGDANFFNDRSALFAGPATNVSLLAQSPPGILWGGGTFITRSNHVLGYHVTSGAAGLYKLPRSTNETVSFTPFPAKPYPPLAGAALLTASFNALGQYAELYGNTGQANQKNPGDDLWFFNPGEGWTNVARSGTTLVIAGETISVSDIGFVGNFTFPYVGTGGGHGTGLTDDGKLYFSVSTHVIAGDSAPRGSAKLVALEVNQAVQDWNNSVLLVENKKTFVRAFLQSPDGAPEPVRIKGARLRGFKSGVELGESPLASVNPGGIVLAPTNAAARRHRLYESLLFQLPANWISGTVELRFEWPDGELTYAEPAEPGGLPGDGIVRATFQRSGRLDVKWVLITYTNAAGESPFAPTIDDAFELEDRLEAVYPIDQLRRPIRFGSWHWQQVDPPTTQNDLQRINSGLERLRRTEKLAETNSPFGLRSPPLYYGLLRGDLAGGKASRPASVACGWMAPDGSDYSRNRHAHELGHLLGRDHVVDETLTNPGESKRGYCGEKASSTAPHFPFHYPLFGGNKPTLGPMDQGPIPMAWGLDTHRRRGSVPRVVNPTNTYELMGYCVSAGPQWKWISTFTYTNLFHAITNRFPPWNHMFITNEFALFNAGSPFLQPGTLADYLLVSGAIDLVTDTASLDPIIGTQFSGPPPAEPPGEYILRLRDAGGAVLNDIPFAPSTGEADAPEIGESTLATFVISVAADPAIHRVEILHGGEVIGTSEASANAPKVTVLSPNGGEVLTNDPVTLQWDGSDLDGDALTYVAQYSADGGETWETLVLDWPQESYTVPRSALRGTEQGRIRVRVSDGFDTAVDDSDNNFTVANHPPELAVLSPADNELVVGDQHIALQADISDLEDGLVPNNRVQWTSNIDGALGTGQELLFNAQSLAEGDHSITVTATDANGGTASRTFRLRVQREAAPSLRIEAGGETVRIAWPAALVDFVLESSANLQPGSWAPVSGEAEVSAGYRKMSLPVSDTGQFFRLRKP
jgi:hypothetical protein